MNSSNGTGSPVALITGGGSGIGAAVARQLLGAGYRVTVTGRGEARLRAFAAKLGDPKELLTVVGSASDHDHVRSAVDRTLDAHGGWTPSSPTPAPPPTTPSPRATRPAGGTWCSPTSSVPRC